MRVSGNRRWYRPMIARDVDEAHRVSTPLELLFDLCFVVAVSQAAARLHHALSGGQTGHGVGQYLLVFFAIWWAWMNFTWFASAYDTDDVLYRITTLIQITGALILAAGVPRAFEHNDTTVAVVGYVVMRLALVSQWVRAAIADPERRRTAIRFAVGVTLVQVAWVARLWIPDNLAVASFLFLVACELAVPVFAERAEHTTWHPSHIAERYGLFTIIVLGEVVLAATTAIQAAFDTGAHRGEVLEITVAGLLTVFSMWWLYFDRPGAHELRTGLFAFRFGYLHYFVFAAAAAVGAGLVVNVDHAFGEAAMSARGAAYTIAIPVAVYLVSVFAVHQRSSEAGLRAVALPVAAVLVLLAPLLPAALPIIAGILVALVALTTAPAADATA
jgi:low temperature requirement protein LtrA